MSPELPQTLEFLKFNRFDEAKCTNKTLSSETVSLRAFSTSVLFLKSQNFLELQVIPRLLEGSELLLLDLSAFLLDLSSLLLDPPLRVLNRHLTCDLRILVMTKALPLFHQGQRVAKPVAGTHRGFQEVDILILDVQLHRQSCDVALNLLPWKMISVQWFRETRFPKTS